MLKLSRNAIPHFLERQRRSRRNARLAFRLGLDTARLTTSCRLQVLSFERMPLLCFLWCVYVNMVTFLLFMFCSVSLYIHNYCLIIAIWRPSGHKMHQIRFPPELCPGPRWGSSRRSPRPRPPSRLGRRTPTLHSPPHRRLRRLDSHAFGVRLGAFGASLPAFRHFFFFTV